MYQRNHYMVASSNTEINSMIQVKGTPTSISKIPQDLQSHGYVS